MLIYSAVAASCALPGIMRPATLMAKDSRGRIVPMDPPGARACEEKPAPRGRVHDMSTARTAGTKYVDGSLRADLPLHRLSQLFHVSQFIVSQVNPHIAPFLETPAQAPRRPRRAARSAAGRWARGVRTGHRPSSRR